jgi:hypothetical protein
MQSLGAASSGSRKGDPKQKTEKGGEEEGRGLWESSADSSDSSCASGHDDGDDNDDGGPGNSDERMHKTKQPY